MPSKLRILASLAMGGKRGKYPCAIITAAGSGTRMGGVSKQLITVGGKRLIEYSLKAFEESLETRGVVISAKADEVDLIKEIVSSGGYEKVLSVVAGGKTRAESVKNAFFALPQECDFAAIHDGARPLITPSDIDAVFKAAYKTGAACAAHKLADTLKTADENGIITGHIDRENAWALQTPQTFLCDLYRASLALAEKDGFTVTDDSSLAVHAGFKVSLVETGAKNFKITTSEDLEMMKKLI